MESNGMECNVMIQIGLCYFQQNTDLNLYEDRIYTDPR